MANYITLKTAIQAVIKTNNNNEITGKILQQQLLAMINSLGSDYQLAGILRPSDTPKTDDQRIAYFAVEPGTYPHAGGLNVTELSLLTYDTAWEVHPLGVPFGSQIAEDITAAIEGEKTRAMAAEKKLSDAIATETNERKAADTALDNDIEAEVTRATNAEDANARAIVNEASTRKSADDALTTKIETEVSDRKTADATLQSNINTEESERKAADATLTKNINTEAFERKNADTALDTRVTAIEDKIPAQATAENKLADKDFVNSSIATATATFRGTFETLEALKAAQADKNDYAFWVHKDEDGNTCYDKYTYTGTEWLFEYRLNNSSFTAAQWAALNSGVTADVIKALQDADKANAKAIADEKVERIAAVNAEATNREDADDALQENIDKKQDIISDLATIRTQAAHGQTAFNWGDHKMAGYVKPFVITITRDGSTENPYRVVGDIDVNDVRNALNANNLILLKDNGNIYPLTYAYDDEEDIYLQFFTIYGDGNEHYEYILTFYGQGTPSIDYFDYMFATYDQVDSEEKQRKAADQALQANIDKKVSKDDEVWLENLMPRIWLNPNGVVGTITVGDSLAVDYKDANVRLSKYGGTVTPYDESVHGRVVQVKGLNDNKLYVTAIFNNGADFSDNYANSLYEIVLTFGTNGAFVNGTYTVKPLGGSLGGSPLVITLATGTGSISDPYKVDKRVQDVLNAIDAKSLIYLYEPTTKDLYPAMYIAHDVANVSVYFAVTWTDDNALWAFYLGTNASGELYVEKYEFSYVIASMLAKINGQNLLNGGEDIKVGVPTIQAGTGNNAEVFNGNPRGRASGNYSHAEGENTQANGHSSHTEGFKTIADCPHSHAEGIYNVEDLYAIHSVGIGTSSTARKDAHRITYDGKHYIPGIGGFDGTKATEDFTNEKDLATVINEMTPVILNYNGLGDNNEPLFVSDDGAALTRAQICALLKSKNANQIVLKNKASAALTLQTSTAKFLQVSGATAFVIGFEGANADGQIFDILYKWDVTSAKVLRAELLYNPTA